MSDVVVDASVWVSRLVTGDVHHARCEIWFREQAASGGVLAAPVFVLAEVAGAISRRTGQRTLARQAIGLLQKLPSLRLVSLDVPLGSLAAQLAADQPLRGADALYVAIALRLGLPLITLDAEQLRRAEAVITMISP